jgi:hypothetical protein
MDLTTVFAVEDIALGSILTEAIIGQIHLFSHASHV